MNKPASKNNNGDDNMCEYKKENKCTILQNKCEKDKYGECAFAEINDDEIVKMAKQIVEIGNIKTPGPFRDHFNYVDVNIIYEDKIDICFSVNGGYERDCNAYWGGEDYVNDLLESLVIPNGIKVTCELDEEDMTGNIIISRGEEMKQQIGNIKKYTIFMENKVCSDIAENTEQYDNENIEFWFNQYIKIEEGLIDLCEQYHIGTKAIFRKEHSGYRFLMGMIHALESKI